MKNKIILWISISAQLCWSFNLENSRSNTSIYTSKNKQLAVEEANNLIQNIRRKLGTDNNIISKEIKSLINNERNNTDKNQISYSTNIKSLFRSTADMFSTVDSYQMPVLIDSSVSLEDFRRKKDDYFQTLCSREMPTKGDQLASVLLNLALEEKNKNVGGAEIVNSAAGNEVLKYIQNSPTFHGKDITHLLGEFKRVQVIDGIVRKLVFGRNGLDIDLSLSMLLTLRTGMEYYFLQAQNCMIDYFNEQDFIFQKRLNEINNNGQSLKEYFKSTVAELQKKGVPITEILSKITGEKNDVEVNYYKKLDRFYESHVFSSTQEEKKFLRERLDHIHGFKDFLRKNYENSIVVHNRLVKITKEQQNYLIDLFLQLQGTSIETSIDKEIYIDYVKKNPTITNIDDINATLNYQQLISDQLSDLLLHLDHESSEKELIKKDSSILHSISESKDKN